jgi:hypothetical protein
MELTNGEQRHSHLSPNTRNLLNHASTRFLVPHHFHRLPRHIDEPEKVNLHLRPDLFLGQTLEFTCEAIARIVDDDIDAAEFLEGCGEGIADGFVVCHVEIDEQGVAAGGAGEAELGAVAGGGNNMVVV